MNESKPNKIKKFLPLAILPLILLICYGLLVNLTAPYSIRTNPDHVNWDLRDFDFSYANARLFGLAEYIPNALLTPDEFNAREDEAITWTYRIGTRTDVDGGPYYTHATTRFRLIVPDGGYYTLTRISTHFTDHIFINGVIAKEIGTPSATAEGEIPKQTRIILTVRPVYVHGLYIIEVVQQNSNHFHRVGGSPHFWMVGRYTLADDLLRIDFTITIILGFYITMALMFFMILILLRTRRHNLYFALLCLMWFMRMGSVDSKLFTVLFPILPASALLRMEYLAVPVAAALLTAIINELFPRLLQKYFRWGIYVVSAIWVLVFLFCNTLFISYAVVYTAYVYILPLIYFPIRLVMKLRKPGQPQIIFLIGAFIYLVAALHDLLSHNFGAFRFTPYFLIANLTQVAFIAFTFCQAVAVFMATMREVEAAKIKEQELATANAALDSLSRMKSEFIANMSHELKTPMTVVSVHVQQAAERYAADGGDNPLVTGSLKRANDEVMHMARMTENTLWLASTQESGSHMKPLKTAELLARSAEAYRAVIEKNGNTLNINIPEHLPQIVGDASKLMQVIANLLTNSNTHTKGGWIEVSAQSTDDFIIVTVKDNGTGLDAKILPQIFERGITGSNGAGIGLPICKNAIETHGGMIKVENLASWANDEDNEQAPSSEHGAVVTFTLPIQQEVDGDA